MPAVCQGGGTLDGSLGDFLTYTEIRASAYKCTEIEKSRRCTARSTNGLWKVTARVKSGILSRKSSKISILVERPVCLCLSRSSVGRAHHR